MNKLLAFLFLGLSIAAQADSLGVHVGTWHEKSGYNNVNPGLNYTTSEGYTAGFYCNSESHSPKYPNSPTCKLSTYAGKDFRTSVRDGVEVGLVAGIVTGYRPDPVMVLVSPHLTVSHAGYEASFLYLPKPNAKSTQALSLMVGRRF